VDRIASVASFFVSRVDALVDAFLEAQIEAEDGPPERLRALKGKAAVANAKLAYARFQEIFSGPRWDALHAAGARVQRPLWASTSAKNPEYRDTVYIDSLIGPDTITTMPQATLDAFIDHGTVRRTVDDDLDEALRVVQDLAAAGIDLESVADHLEAEGIAAFAQAHDDLIAGIERKRLDLAAQAAAWGGALQAPHWW
jgi:transaldolase